jgi:hypothetical protein
VRRPNQSQGYALVTMLLIIAAGAAFFAHQSGIGTLIAFLGVLPATVLYWRAERREKRRNA